jgi:hypothetical protein
LLKSIANVRRGAVRLTRVGEFFEDGARNQNAFGSYMVEERRYSRDEVVQDRCGGV